MNRGTTAKTCLNVGLLGRRDVGKSSLLRALTGQRSSIVPLAAAEASAPVTRTLELQPLGQVQLVDMVGIDDLSEPSQLRAELTQQLLDRLDLAILVAEAGRWEGLEQRLLVELESRSTPVIVVMNKADVHDVPPTLQEALADRCTRTVLTVATTGQGLEELRAALVALAPGAVPAGRTLVSDLVPPGEVALLIAPAAGGPPEGQPVQAQALADLVDHGRLGLVTSAEELKVALAALVRPPALVVSSSRELARVAAETPPEVPLTTYSVLLSRHKGALAEQALGALTLARLEPGARLLVTEACPRHPEGDDVDRGSLSRLLGDLVGGPLRLDLGGGRSLPEGPSTFALAVHCDACLWTELELLELLSRCRKAGLPSTSYGLTVARCLGLLERVLDPLVSVEPGLEGFPGLRAGQQRAVR